MVIAIERNHWPMEWRYLIRLEQPGKLPQPRTTILDRGPLNPLDDRHYITPEESTFQDNDVAFFFNAFERPLRVTIKQIVEPGSYETVRMTQPSQRDQSPRMEIQTIESHRLFTQEMLSHYEDTVGEELMLATTPHMVTTCWQKTELESLPHIGNDTLTIPGQMGPPENSAPRPDGIVINKNHRTIYILEFKRSSDRNKDLLRVKEDEANEQHRSIIEALKAAAPEWTFEPIDFVAGRRGALVEDDFYNKLKRLNVQAGKREKILLAHVQRICKAHDTVMILLSANTWVVWG